MPFRSKSYLLGRYMFIAKLPNTCTVALGSSLCTMHWILWTRYFRKVHSAIVGSIYLRKQSNSFWILQIHLSILSTFDTILLLDCRYLHWWKVTWFFNSFIRHKIEPRMYINCVVPSFIFDIAIGLILIPSLFACSRKIILWKVTEIIERNKIGTG